MNYPGKKSLWGVLALCLWLLPGCTAQSVEPTAIFVPTVAFVASSPPFATDDPCRTDVNYCVSTSAPTADLCGADASYCVSTHTPIATAIMPPTVTPLPTATPLPSATPCTQPGRMEQGFFPSAVAGEPQSYRIYLPPCYGENGRLYPTLYMLAGNTYTDALWDQFGLDEAAEAGIQSGELPPMIIVMPYSGETAFYTSGGPNSYETVILEELTSYIEATYCAGNEPAYRALGGVSRGGYWALEIAFRHPEAFVSVGGHSAALIDEFAKPPINPQYTALANDLGDLRIYLDIGSEDWVRTNTLQLHADMVAAGIAHTWVLNEGMHEESYWVKHLAEYLAWYSEPWSKERNDYPLCKK